MSTYNICFHGVIRNCVSVCTIRLKSALPGAMSVC